MILNIKNIKFYYIKDILKIISLHDLMNNWDLFIFKKNIIYVRDPERRSIWNSLSFPSTVTFHDITPLVNNNVHQAYTTN